MKKEWLYFIAGAVLMAAVMSFQMPKDTSLTAVSAESSAEPKQEKKVSQKESPLEEARRIWELGNKLFIENDDLWLLIEIQDQSINKKLVRIVGNWGSTSAFFEPKQRTHTLFQPGGSGRILIQMPDLSNQGIKHLMMGDNFTGNLVVVEGVILISNQSISLVSFQKSIDR